MNVVLKPETDKLLKRLVAEGQFPSEAEAIHAAVIQMTVNDESIDWEWVRQALAEADQSVANGNVLVVDSAGLNALGEDIKRQGRERLAARKAGAA